MLLCTQGLCDSAGLPEVAVGGRDLSFWTFDANNVLAWQDEAGYTAWLQFTVLPGGPVFMGTLHPSTNTAEAGDSSESPLSFTLHCVSQYLDLKSKLRAPCMYYSHAAKEGGSVELLTKSLLIQWGHPQLSSGLCIPFWYCSACG